MELRQRKPLRLKDRDYSHDGYYFITICVKDRWPILCNGEAYDPETNRLPLSETGELVRQRLETLPAHYPGTRLEQYVIMPNHIHLILVLHKGQGRSAPSVSQMVQMMKGAVTKSLGYSIWQKSFHDRIIRDDTEYLRIWEYIENNPAKWREDCYYTVKNS